MKKLQLWLNQQIARILTEKGGAGDNLIRNLCLDLKFLLLFHTYK